MVILHSGPHFSGHCQNLYCFNSKHHGRMAVVLFVHNLTCTLNDTGHTYDVSACSINRFYQYVQNQFNLAENLRCANPCFYPQNQAGRWQYKPCLVGHFCMEADVIFWEEKTAKMMCVLHQHLTTPCWNWSFQIQAGSITIFNLDKSKGLLAIAKLKPLSLFHFSIISA